MKTRKNSRNRFTFTPLCFLLAGLAPMHFPALPSARAAENAPAPGVWSIGVGTSLLAAPAEAGSEAAAQALAAHGPGEAKLVLVFAVAQQLTPELIEGVAKHFPKNIIYGANVVAPLTPTTNLPDQAPSLESAEGVGVLAIGGDVTITIAADTLQATTAEATAEDADAAFASYRESGGRLGRQLLPALKSCPRPGKLLLTFGNQFNGSNTYLAMGFRDALGDDLKAVGVSAGNSRADMARVIAAGEIAQDVNVAVLFCGDFRIGISLDGGTHTPALANAVLGAAMEQGGPDAKPFFGFVFNCRRRRIGMIQRKQLAEELAVIQKHFDGAPFFGAYGPGEIGIRKPGVPAEGTGFSVSTALLFPLAAP